MISAGTLLSRKYDAGEGVAARLQICPKAWCVGASNWPASGPRSIPRYRPRCWGSRSSGNTVKARVLSTVARERSRRRVIVLCISSKDAYRSSAGREAHCRLACVRMVIVLSSRLIEGGNALNAVRPQRRQAGRAQPVRGGGRLRRRNGVAGAHPCLAGGG